jgi:hypothetical protein
MIAPALMAREEKNNSKQIIMILNNEKRSQQGVVWKFKGCHNCSYQRCVG